MKLNETFPKISRLVRDLPDYHATESCKVDFGMLTEDHILINVMLSILILLYEHYIVFFQMQTSIIQYKVMIIMVVK